MIESGAPRYVAAFGAIVLGALLWGGIHRLGYSEFGIALHQLRHNRFRSTVRLRVSLSRLEQSLSAAQSAEECWHGVRALSLEFGFSAAALELGGRHFHEQLGPSVERCWMLRIPLSDEEYVECWYPREPTREPLPVARLADVLERILSAKAAALESGSSPAPRKAIAAAASARGFARNYHGAPELLAAGQKDRE